MLNAVIAALAGSQAKTMGVVGGISLLINQFRHELSMWLSDQLGHSIRPEVLDVVFTLFTFAMIVTVAVAFVLYLVKSISRARKSQRLARDFAKTHMGAVAAMSGAVSNGGIDVSLRSALTDLVHDVEVLQKKSKRLRKRNPDLEAAYAEYVHQLTVFSAALGGAQVSDSQPVEPNMGELTEAAFGLLGAFGWAEKSRKFRKDKIKTRADAVEVDHALRAQMSFKPAQQPAEAASEGAEDVSDNKEAAPSPKTKMAAPDVISRTQIARAGKRMTRRERRKLGPMDRPEKVRAARHTSQD